MTDWPQPAPVRRPVCPFYPHPDPDYCNHLAHGICWIEARPCPVVLRDGPTPQQIINDVILALAGPLVAAWAKKIQGKKGTK